MSDNTAMGRALDWFSRTLAILIVMVGPGWLGSLMDQRFRTQFWAPIGAVLGMLLATMVLLIIARSLTPPAGGKPIPFPDDSEETFPDDSGKGGETKD